MASRPLLSSDLRRVIRSGMGMKFWSDPWVPDIPGRPRWGLSPKINPHLYVSDIIDFTTKAWKIDELRYFSTPEDLPQILSIRPSASFSNDSYSWTHPKSGSYTVSMDIGQLRLAREEIVTSLFRD